MDDRGGGHQTGHLSACCALGGLSPRGIPEKPPLQEAAGQDQRFENLLLTGGDGPGCPWTPVLGGWFLLRSCQKSLTGCTQWTRLGQGLRTRGLGSVPAEGREGSSRGTDDGDQPFTQALDGETGAPLKDGTCLGLKLGGWGGGGNPRGLCSRQSRRRPRRVQGAGQLPSAGAQRPLPGGCACPSQGAAGWTRGGLLGPPASCPQRAFFSPLPTVLQEVPPRPPSAHAEALAGQSLCWGLPPPLELDRGRPGKRGLSGV